MIFGAFEGLSTDTGTISFYTFMATLADLRSAADQEEHDAETNIGLKKTCEFNSTIEMHEYMRRNRKFQRNLLQKQETPLTAAQEYGWEAAARSVKLEAPTKGKIKTEITAFAAVRKRLCLLIIASAPAVLPSARVMCLTLNPQTPRSHTHCTLTGTHQVRPRVLNAVLPRGRCSCLVYYITLWLCFDHTPTLTPTRIGCLRLPLLVLRPIPVVRAPMSCYLLNLCYPLCSI